MHVLHWSALMEPRCDPAEFHTRNTTGFHIPLFLFLDPPWLRPINSTTLCLRGFVPVLPTALVVSWFASLFSPRALCFGIPRHRLLFCPYIALGSRSYPGMWESVEQLPHGVGSRLSLVKGEVEKPSPRFPGSLELGYVASL